MSIKQGLANLRRFLSVIWNFNRYDGYSTLDVLKQCLVLTKPQMKGYEGCEKVQRQMQSCIDCIDRIVTDDYCKKEWAELEQKYGKFKMEKGLPLPNGSIPVTVRREGGIEIDDRTLGKLERQLWELESHRRNQDIETLFNTMKNFRKWWV